MSRFGEDSITCEHCGSRKFYKREVCVINPIAKKISRNGVEELPGRLIDKTYEYACTECNKVLHV